MGLMKLCLGLCLALMLIAVTACQEEEEKENSFVLISIGALENEVVERVAKHLSDSYYGVPVDVVYSGAPAGTPEKTAKQIHKKLRNHHKGALALISVEEDVEFRMGVFKSEKTALLNARSLSLEKMNSEKARGIYEKRLKKESVRALGLLIGLQPTPFPRCAMFPWSNDKQLDSKGLNLCPPNHVKARKILEELGFELQ